MPVPATSDIFSSRLPISATSQIDHQIQLAKKNVQRQKKADAILKAKGSGRSKEWHPIRKAQGMGKSTHKTPVAGCGFSIQPNPAIKTRKPTYVPIPEGRFAWRTRPNEKYGRGYGIKTLERALSNYFPIIHEGGHSSYPTTFAKRGAAVPARHRVGPRGGLYQLVRGGPTRQYFPH